MKNCLLYLVFLFPLLLTGQQNEFNWRLGAYGGIMTHHGDLSYRLIDPNPKLNNLLDNLDYLSYGISLERRLSNAFTFGLLWTQGSFIANDRTVNWKGDLLTDNPNFERSLNAKTKLWDFSITASYYLDNGSVLGRRSVVAPYFKIGGGITNFNVYGDLFYGTEQHPYHYWSDGSIRDQSEGTADAMVIEQDGKFETRLNGLATEGVNYDNQAFSLTGGFGIKFRLGRFNLNLESLIRWVDSDYLDDVSGDFPADYDSELQRYASNPANITRDMRGGSNGRHDLYSFTTISLHYNFGRKKTEFSTPSIVIGPLSRFSGHTTFAANTPKKAERDQPQPVEDEEADEADAGETSDSITMQVREDSVMVAETEAEMTADTTATGEVISDTTVVARTETFPDSTAMQVREDSVVVAETGADTTATGEVISDTTVVARTETLPDSTAMQIREDSITVAESREEIQEESAEPGEPVSDTTVTVRTEVPDGNSPERISENDVSGTDTREEVREGSAEPGESVADSLLTVKMRDLEDSHRQLQSEVYRLQDLLNNQPTLVYDTVITDEHIDRYQDELNTLRRQREEGRELDPREKELMEKYQLALGDLQRQVDESVRPEEYQELQKEVQQLRRQLNITTGVGAAAGATALLTRPGRNDASEEMVRQLQARVDSLDELIRRSPPVGLMPDSMLQSDSLLWEQYGGLSPQLDSLLNSPGMDPTIGLLHANFFRQQDSLQRQKQQLKVQENELNELKGRLSFLESRLGVPTGNLNENNAAINNGMRQQLVFFGLGSSDLNLSARQTIEQAADLIRNKPDWKIILKGYTDKSGSPAANQRLADRRVNSVLVYFTSLGISRDQLVAEPVGIDLETSDPAYGRRVEMLLRE